MNGVSPGWMNIKQSWKTSFLPHSNRFKHFIILINLDLLTDNGEWHHWRSAPSWVGIAPCNFGSLPDSLSRKYVLPGRTQIRPAGWTAPNGRGAFVQFQCESMNKERMKERKKDFEKISSKVEKQHSHYERHCVQQKPEVMKQMMITILFFELISS